MKNDKNTTKPATDVYNMLGAGRPKLLNLFCCAGGASMDYHLAGFDVVGVDIAPQYDIKGE